MIFWAQFMGKVGSLRPLAIRWIWQVVKEGGDGDGEAEAAVSQFPSSMPC